AAHAPIGSPTTLSCRSSGSKRAASAVEPSRPKLRSQVPTSTALLIAGHCESRNFERGERKRGSERILFPAIADAFGRRPVFQKARYDASCPIPVRYFFQS